MRRPILALRGRVVVAIAAVALAPHALVLVWSQIDRPVPGRMWTNVRDATEDARARLARGEPPGVVADAVARKRGVRIRLAAEGGARVLADVDADDPSSPLDRVEAFFLRPPGARSLREIDLAEGPLEGREDVRAALGGVAPRVACRVDELLYCQAVSTLPGTDTILHVQESSFRAVSAVYQLRAQLLRLGLLVWPLAIVLAWVTASRIVRPIEHLRQQALARTRESTQPLEPDGNDEVADLAGAFNRLLDAIAEERAEHGEFVADLVHELKSPTATVRATADALDEESAPERTRRLARGLRDSAKKLESTVDRFLDIARAEAGFPREARERVDLAALARAVVERRANGPRFADVTFAAVAADEVVVVGVADRLEALLEELVDNGGSFAPRGGTVTVRVAPEGDEVRIHVEDDGPGIPDDQLAKVFGRFYTTRGHARGTGLGLPFVRAVARAHGGDVTAMAGRTVGAAFEVRLPRAR
jgi:signal transduction histidine kinase